MKQLAPDTVALRITSAKTTQARRPFGCCGLWFTRKPSVIAVSEVGEKKATLLLNERALDVVELVGLPEVLLDFVEPAPAVEVIAVAKTVELEPRQVTVDAVIEVKPLAPELPHPVITFEVDSEPEPTPEPEPEPPPKPRPKAKVKPKAKKTPAKRKPRKRRGA